MPEPPTVDQIVAYRPGVFKLCRRILNNTEAAKDATQDVLIEACRHADTFRGDAKVWTWLYRIAVNRCRNLQKHDQRKPPPLPLEGLIKADEPVTYDELIPDPSAEFVPLLISAEAKRLVLEEFEWLPDDDRLALGLHYHADMSYLDAAGSLGISVGAYKSRLFRARCRLAERLQRNPVWRDRQDPAREGETNGR